MKKILFSDYDQTLYINDDDIKKNIESIKKFRQKGNIFAIVTGRSYEDFLDVYKKYSFPFDYVILDHGALIINEKKEIYNSITIFDEVIPQIVKDLKHENSLRFFCSSCFDSRVDYKHCNINKIHVKYNTPDESKFINELINKKYSKYINSYLVSSRSVEIISNNIDKSKAISILTSKIKINHSNIYTIGDGYSDIKMIKDYKGACMINSIPELLQLNVSKYNSVSEFIENILLEEKGE